MAKRLIITKTQGIVISFIDVETKEQFDFTVPVEEVMREKAMMHGFKQTLSDAAAGEKTGEGKLAAIKSRAAQLRSGEWGKAKKSELEKQIDNFKKVHGTAPTKEQAGMLAALFG